MRLFAAPLVRTNEMRHNERRTPLGDHVITRPASTGFWPSGPGRLRIVRRGRRALLVTDGLSDPWSPELHATPPRFTFDIELALEVPTETLASTTDSAITKSWMPALLWALTDWVVAARVDIKAHLVGADFMTLGIPPGRGLARHVALHRRHGVMIGRPVVAPIDGYNDVSLLTAKLLATDEYEWAVKDPDGSRVRELARAFLGGDGGWSQPERRSIRSIRSLCA